MDALDFTGRGVVVTGGTRGIGAAIASAFLAAGARVLVCARHDPTSLPTAGDATGFFHADPAQGGDAVARLVRADPAQGGDAVAGLVRADPPQGGDAAAGSARADPPRAGDAAAGSVRADPTQPGGAAAEFFRADVRDPEQAAALVAAAVERFGRLDVVVNNAGGAPSAPAGTASPRLHAKIIELNLLAPLHVSQAANAVMREQPGGGVILMIGSVSGVRPSPGTAAYGAAKAGLHHLATTLAMEWAPQVRVNSLVVGPVATGEALDPAALARTVPMGRPATPAEVAGACLLLASPLAGYVSGAALAVHGGGEWPGYLADLRAAAYPAQK